MRERRQFLYLSFSVIILLISLSGLLIFFEKGGSAEFDMFGQKFSSTNIGLAVLFIAALIFVYVLREFTKGSDEARRRRQIYASSCDGGEITWNEVIDGIQDLTLQLTSASGFRPDLVIGICGGGLVVADIVSKRLGHIPCLAIWANRHTLKDDFIFGGQAKKINRIALDEIIRASAVERILIVDDAVYSGTTLQAATEFIVSRSELIRDGSVEIRTAALFALITAKFKPDFVIYTHPKDRKKMPSSDRHRV